MFPSGHFAIFFSLSPPVFSHVSHAYKRTGLTITLIDVVFNLFDAHFENVYWSATVLFVVLIRIFTRSLHVEMNGVTNIITKTSSVSIKD